MLDALLAEEVGFSSFLLEALAALELLAALDAALEEAALLAGSSCLVEGALAGASLAAGEEAAASLEEAASLSAALEAASRSGSAALELLEVLAVAVGRKSSSRRRGAPQGELIGQQAAQERNREDSHREQGAKLDGFFLGRGFVDRLRPLGCIDGAYLAQVQLACLQGGSVVGFFRSVLHRDLDFGGIDQSRPECLQRRPAVGCVQSKAFLEHVVQRVRDVGQGAKRAPFSRALAAMGRWPLRAPNRQAATG